MKRSSTSKTATSPGRHAPLAAVDVPPYLEQRVIYAAARDITERKAAEATLTSYARALEISQQELEEQAARLAQLVRELEAREAQGGGSNRREERLPRQHEPRDPHAPQCHPRDDLAGAADAPHGRTAGLPRDREVIGGRASRTDQRHPGLFEDRSAPARFGAREFDVREEVGMRSSCWRCARAKESSWPVMSRRTSPKPYAAIWRLRQVLLNIVKECHHSPRKARSFLTSRWIRKPWTGVTAFRHAGYRHRHTT